MIKRLPKHKPPNVLNFNDHNVAYFSCFTREGWERLSAVSSDDNFDEPYDQWLACQAEGIRQLTAAGFIIKKTPVDVTELLDWCHKHKRRFNSRTLARFLFAKRQA